MTKLKASNTNKPRLITSFSDQSKFDPSEAVKAPDCGVWMIKEGIHATYPKFEKGLRVLNHYYDGTALFCQAFLDPTSVVIGRI